MVQAQTLKKNPQTKSNSNTQIFPFQSPGGPMRFGEFFFPTPKHWGSLVRLRHTSLALQGTESGNISRVSRRERN